MGGVNEGIQLDFQEVLNRVELAEPQPEITVDLESRVDDSQQILKERETERIGREKYYLLRDTWSRNLKHLLQVSVYFQVLLAVFVGLNVLVYEKYNSFLMLVAGENFLQIAGMAYIVVKFLFPNTEKDNTIVTK